jgi:hypothetical protein
VLTFVYAHGPISETLAISEQYLTEPSHVWTADTTVRAILIWDDSPEAGGVVVENSGGEVDDNLNIGKYDWKYWIIVVKPKQKCRVLGRCKFWLFS